MPNKGKKVRKEVNYVIQGLRLLDAHTLKEAYKDHTSVKDFLKLLKQKSKDKSAEKEKAKKLSLDIKDGHLTVSTEPASPAVTPTPEDDDDDSPFSRYIDDLPGFSDQLTQRTVSEPGPDIFAVPEAEASRSLSTEEKVQGTQYSTTKTSLLSRHVTG